MELLRGRDGLPGRDGVQGPVGPPGPVGTPGKQGPPGPRSGGATYTRWGKSTCPQVEGTELVYSGITGGTYYASPGGANHLCMPKNPEYSPALRYRNNLGSERAFIQGTEYQSPLQGLDNHNAPCAVCHVSTRSTILMIPAKASCPSTWTREYYGYLMTEKGEGRHRRSMFECVDADQEVLPGTQVNIDAALLYHVEATCNTGLPCLPYVSNKQLNCVVCTK